MLKLVVLLTLVAVIFATASLKKSYGLITTKELKRRAKNGDQLAETLHKAVAYGHSLNILLWLIFGLSSVLFFVILARSLAAWAAAVLSLIVFWVGFAWLPNSRPTIVSEYIVRIFTPVVAWLLRKLHPVLRHAERYLKDKGRISIHSGLYEKEDLIDLLNNQKSQIDNHITPDELRIARGALEFSDKLVGAVMIPRRMAKMVKLIDSVGPVLMNELHSSGHSRFPVYEGKQDNVVGMLYLRDLVEKNSNGKVADLMHPGAVFVNEQSPLGNVLQAFLKTKQHLFVVVNGFEEVVGIITIEDILEQIIGKPIMDEFDKYEDLREVAKLHGEKDRKEHKTIQADEKETEVVE